MNKSSLMKDDEILISAYLDNELSGEERAHVESKLIQDTKFAQRFKQHEQLNIAIEARYSHIDDTPVSAELKVLLADTQQRDTLASASIVGHSIAHKKKPFKMVINKFLPLAAAIATVALIFPLIVDKIDTSKVQLTEALDTKLSGQEIQLANASVMTIIMTFENKQSQLCREYVIREDINISNSKQVISCKIDQQWQQVIAAEYTVVNSDGFQPASSNSSPEIESWLDVHMDGEVYSLEQEETLIKGLDKLTSQN